MNKDLKALRAEAVMYAGQGWGDISKFASQVLRVLRPFTRFTGDDWNRIEASLHEIVRDLEDEYALDDSAVNVQAIDSYKRTLDKVQKLNNTGKYTIQ